MQKKILLAFGIILVIAVGIALYLNYKPEGETTEKITNMTASIGNSRMVLRIPYSEEIEKYVLVKNVNDFPVSIELFTSGDLAESVKLKDEGFELAPKKEKRAYFTIRADKEGLTETKINVKFTPKNGNSVGLASTVILITQNSSMINKTSGTVGGGKGIGIGGILLSITTVILVIILIILLSSKKLKQKGAIKPKKSNRHE